MTDDSGQNHPRHGGQVIRGRDGSDHQNGRVCGAIYADRLLIDCTPAPGTQLADKMVKSAHLTGLQMVLSLTGGDLGLSGEQKVNLPSFA